MRPMRLFRPRRWRRGRRSRAGKRTDAGARSRLRPRLPALVHRLKEDVAVVCEKDPAVTSRWEVLLYPHLHALWLHRVAHALYRRRLRVAARAVAFFARSVSGGIDIHPGARIGRRFFIDHGCGVVIGETAVIGDDVMLYHLVTLGSVGWWTDLNRPPDARRHPCVGDGVVVGTGSCILGPVDIGAGSRIGAHSVVLTSLPAQARVPTGQVIRPGAPVAAGPTTERTPRHADPLPHHMRPAEPKR